MEKMITIPERKYLELRRKAELDEELLVKLIRGLEDIKADRIKAFKQQNSLFLIPIND